MTKRRKGGGRGGVPSSCKNRDAACKLGQHRTNELVRWQMNFLSDAIADFAGLLAVNQEICKQQMAKKALPTLPTNCAVLP